MTSSCSAYEQNSPNDLLKPNKIMHTWVCAMAMDSSTLRILSKVNYGRNANISFIKQPIIFLLVCSFIRIGIQPQTFATIFLCTYSIHKNLEHIVKCTHYNYKSLESAQPLFNLYTIRAMRCGINWTCMHTSM